ncbi:uridine kinase family protein [Streptomyces zingiberis]|uniref:uridine kinase family protein n=1 Tax=Streptomyces zingiberis TaxID=2053010 RepID=UPI0035D49B67
MAVDGHAGSGKSTFTGRLAAALGGAPVVHLDDLATHEEPFGWTDRFRRQLLLPFAHGRPGRHQVYDWEHGRFTGEREVAPAPVVLVEGVGAGRRALRPSLALLCWMDLAAGTAWERGRRRDGPELSTFWDGWTRSEQKHFAGDPTRPHADLLVRQGPEGYLWFWRTGKPE